MSQDSVDMLKNKALNKLIDIKLKESQLLKFNYQYQPDKFTCLPRFLIS